MHDYPDVAHVFNADAVDGDQVCRVGIDDRTYINMVSIV